MGWTVKTGHGDRAAAPGKVPQGVPPLARRSGRDMTMRPVFRAALPYVGLPAVGLLLVIAAAVFTATTPGGTLTAATIVATLQSDGRVYPPALQAALRATRRQPGDLPAAKAAARLLITEGRNAGDARLVGAAVAVLRPFLANPDAQTLTLVATARQYQHDFPGALTLLEAAIGLDPTDIDAILTRATVQIVRGRFDLAGLDCDRLNGLARPDVGFLCHATSRLLTADAPQIYDRLGALLAQPGLLAPALQGWARGLQGEIAALQGNSAVAQGHLAAVIAADPLALRERLLLADLLLAEGEAARVLAVLDPAIAADGVLIRRVLAARAVGAKAVAQAATVELAQRVALNLDLGLTAHAREETLYFLRIAQDPGMALQRALVNWNLQHEIEDAQLLVDAAMFAGRPEAAAPVVGWMAAQSIRVPSFRMPDAVREAAR